MNKWIFSALMIFLSGMASAQKVYTKNGSISFFSKTDMEDISAKNNQVMSVLNTSTGEMQFSVLIKSFKFEKSLMEEHFNENYMESEKFPKATFKGMVENIDKVNFAKDGNYPVTVSGDMTIHGETNKVTATGSIVVEGGKATGKSKFKVLLADYKIVVPKLVRDNISESIEITVNCLYDQKM